MIAAAETGRDLIYFTFRREETLRKLEKISGIIKTLNVSQAYELIGEYAKKISGMSLQEIQRFGLSEFLSTRFSAQGKFLNY